MRKIADELGYNDRTIRFDVEKLSLPEDELAAILNGESAEPYLRKARMKRTGKDGLAERRKKKWLAKEKKTGKFSSDLAEELLNWLATKNTLTSDEEVQLLKAVRQKNKLPDRPDTRSNDPAKELALCEGKGKPSEKIGLINFYERVLVCALYRIEPLREIRDSAVEKALKTVNEREPHPNRPARWKSELERIRSRRG
jgi:hypothetical protein